MAKGVVFDISLGDVHEQFQSAQELKDYVSGKITTMIKQAATEAWNLPRPRALSTDFGGDFLGFWQEDQPVYGRGVEVSVSVGIRF